MQPINAFLDLYGLLAIFVLLLVKAIGVPIPIPADAIMLAAAARAAEGRFVLWQTFFASLLALVLGGIIHFSLVRGPGRAFLYRFGRYLGLTPARLDAASARMHKSGTLGIALAILTPGVRSVAVTACGLAGLPLRVVAVGLTIGTALFLSLHFFLGYVGGVVLSSLRISLLPTVALVVVLLMLGLAAWVVIRLRQNPGASAGETVAEAFEAWHEATCPVCLALGAASRFEAHT